MNKFSKSMKWYFICLLVLVFVSSCQNSTNMIEASGKYYEDYDIFKREGINELDPSNLKIPYIEEHSRTDSIIVLHIYSGRLRWPFSSSNEKYDEVLLPARDSVIVQAKHTYKDGPSYVYGTIIDDKVIRYGYFKDPYNQSIKQSNSLYIWDVSPIIYVSTVDTIFEIDYYEYQRELHGYSLPIANGDFNGLGWSEMEEWYSLPVDEDIDALMNSEYSSTYQYVKDSLGYRIYILDLSNGNSIRTSIPREFDKWIDHLNPSHGI